MSFAASQIALKGSPIHGSKFLLCHYCEEKKMPEGGIQLSPRRWVCAVCWVDKLRALKGKK